MPKPVYGKTGRGGGLRANRVKGGVGMVNMGQVNLLRHTARNSRGQYQATEGAQRLNPEAYRWNASYTRYRNLSFSGQMQELITQIDGWSKHITHDCYKVLYNAMLPTFNLSQVYCPVSPNGSRPYGESGTLKRSGRLVVKHKAGTIGGPNSPAEVQITYGGNGVPFYAVYVHEIPRRHEAPTRYKFLESAIKEDMSNIQQRLVDGMRLVASGRG